MGVNFPVPLLVSFYCTLFVGRRSPARVLTLGTKTDVMFCCDGVKATLVVCSLLLRFEFEFEIWVEKRVQHDSKHNTNHLTQNHTQSIQSNLKSTSIAQQNGIAFETVRGVRSRLWKVLHHRKQTSANGDRRT